MRYFLLLGLSLVLSCKTTEEVPAGHTSTPVVVGNDTLATVTTVSVGKKSTVNVQVGGTGNTASAAKTDNTGRAAAAGANGGHSVETTTNKTPLWAIVLVVVVSAGGGGYLVYRLQTRRKAAAVLLGKVAELPP